MLLECLKSFLADDFEKKFFLSIMYPSLTWQISYKISFAGKNILTPDICDITRKFIEQIDLRLIWTTERGLWSFRDILLNETPIE